jgi:hypothetical protein
MKTKHTKEPWFFTGSTIGIQLLEGVAIDVADVNRWCPGTPLRDEDESNGERIVACVNACAGINPEAVPDLLKACRDLAYAYRALSEKGVGMAQETIQEYEAWAAIAKSERV